MISSRVLQLLLLVSSITSPLIGMETKKASLPFWVEGIAQMIEELPKELQYKIFSFALELRENPKYEVYKKLDVGSKVKGLALNADNTRALTGSEDGVARVWDVEKGTILIELKDHTKAISSVALSADGTLALTGSEDGTARVWNMNTGELLKTLELGYGVTSVALSADGARALTGCLNKNVRLYNTSTGELLKVLEGHKGYIPSVALSADGTLALTGSFDGTAIVWDILTEKSIVFKVDSAIGLIALSADGTLALIGTSNSKVLVWDTKSGTVLNTLLPDSSYIFSVALSKDRKRALVCTTDKKIQVWNTQPLPGEKETSTFLTELAGYASPVGVVAFGGNDFIVGGSYDKTVIIWKPYALKPQEPREHKEVLWMAYKEIFSKPLLNSKSKPHLL